MSFIWNVILSFGDGEYWRDGEETECERCAALDAINQWMPPDAKLVDLTRPTFKRGCGTGMTAHLYGGGFKHFDAEGFIAAVSAQSWRDPANVQLFLKSDADDQFFLQPLFAGKRKWRTTPSNAGWGEVRRLHHLFPVG